MSKKYIIRKIEPEEYPIWDDFVDQSDEGTIFHKSFWIEASDLTEFIIGVFVDGRLVAGASFTYRINKIGQKNITNPYLTPYSGIIFENNNSKYVSKISKHKVLSKKIIDYLLEHYSNISFGLSLTFKDLQPFIWNGFKTDVKYTYILDITDLEKCWQQMDSGSCRNSINKAKKDNLIIVKEDDFNIIVKLVSLTLKRNNKKSKIKKLNKYAWNYYNVLIKKGMCKSFICYNNDQPIGGAFIVWDNKRSYYLLGGYDSDNSHVGASTFAIWEAIKYSSIELGLKEFDFEGSMIQPIEQFFRKFGGTLTPNYRVSKTTLLNKIYQKLSKYKLQL